MLKLAGLAALTGAALLFVGCAGQELGKTIGVSDTQCASGEAEIGVNDGYFQVLCGCQEAAGTIAAPPAQFTCTVHHGTEIFFDFLQDRYKHQLVPGASSSFVSTPIADPEDPDWTRIVTENFSSPGTYSFLDSFNATMNGQIVVIP